MVVILLLAQVVLVVLAFATNVLGALSLWVVFLPLMLIVVLWLTAQWIGRTLVIDSFTHMYGGLSEAGIERARKRARQDRTEQIRNAYGHRRYK